MCSAFPNLCKLASRPTTIWRLVVIGYVLLIGATNAGMAQGTFYWDRNGTTAGAGTTPNGTWDTTSGNWNTTSGGTTANETFVSGGNARFSAGTDATGSYTVTVSGTQNVSGITIQEGTPTFTGGTINFSDATPTLVINAGRTLNWGSTVLTSTSSNTVNVSGGGTLNFTADQTFAGTVNLSGGTLRLTTADLTFTTLNITGNTVIDFAGTASSLNLTNFSISSGVTLTIQNWALATDFFYTANWTGAVANTMGSAPMNQITFNGFAASQTGWDSFDNRIRPNVPEPSTYGAILLGTLTSLVAWRRRRA